MKLTKKQSDELFNRGFNEVCNKRAETLKTNPYLVKIVLINRFAGKKSDFFEQLNESFNVTKEDCDQVHQIEMGKIQKFFEQGANKYAEKFGVTKEIFINKCFELFGELDDNTLMKLSAIVKNVGQHFVKED